jgi:rhamnose utilization protein RhaD (predicted bifunctional aldolase and dehydrogenase)
MFPSNDNRPSAQPGKSTLLSHITSLSKAYGGPEYVCGGGGNTSAKNNDTLWVKPSGTTLAGLSPAKFLPLSREMLGYLYRVTPSRDPAARERLVQEMMANAVTAGASGRASVEAPLHDSLNATYVVHTHPALVNGMTCAKDGKAVCGKLFPNAMWLDYIDPGYTLCMEVRKHLKEYSKEHGRQPDVIFLKNHGVFVQADSVADMESLYTRMFLTLEAEYGVAGVATELPVSPVPGEKIKAAKDVVKEAFQNQKLCFAVSGRFDYAAVPISPDHMVYSKAYPFIGTPSRGAISRFEREHGYKPRVMVWDDLVIGVEASQKAANLALELFQNGALVKQLAEAFGDLEPMTDQARKFIENWEVESYREKQMR